MAKDGRFPCKESAGTVLQNLSPDASLTLQICHKYEGPVIVDAKLYKLYGPPELFFENPSHPIRPKSDWFEVVALECLIDSVSC